MCWRPLPPVDGVCGALKDSCTSGTWSDVADGPTQYKWLCNGVNGGDPSPICNAPIPVLNGACGSAHNNPKPSNVSNRCTTGTVSGWTNGTEETWSCVGSGGGTNASCSTQSPSYIWVVLDDSCQPDPGNSVLKFADGSPDPEGTSCSTQGVISWWSSGSCWNSFECDGSATPVNGSCGSSHRAALTTKPTTNLCNIGTAGTVLGIGEWQWTCNGSGGGTNASCVTKGVCGSEHGNASCTGSPSSFAACEIGDKSEASGSGPWSWKCGVMGAKANCFCGSSSSLADGTICTYVSTAPDTTNGMPSCSSCLNVPTGSGERFTCDSEDYAACGDATANCLTNGSICNGSCADM